MMRKVDMNGDGQQNSSVSQSWSCDKQPWREKGQPRYTGSGLAADSNNYNANSLTSLIIDQLFSNVT